MRKLTLLELFTEHKREMKEELMEIKKEIKELSKFHWKVSGAFLAAVVLIEGIQSVFHL